MGKLLLKQSSDASIEVPLQIKKMDRELGLGHFLHFPHSFFLVAWNLGLTVKALAAMSKYGRLRSR